MGVLRQDLRRHMNRSRVDDAMCVTSRRQSFMGIRLRGFPGNPGNEAARQKERRSRRRCEHGARTCFWELWCCWGVRLFCSVLEHSAGPVPPRRAGRRARTSFLQTSTVHLQRPPSFSRASPRSNRVQPSAFVSLWFAIVFYTMRSLTTARSSIP